MPNPQKAAKPPEPKAGDLKNDLWRANQFSERRRRDLATRSTLNRLRNRKSDLK